MGLSLGPVFDKQFPEDKLFAQFSDGKVLTGAMDRFDDISRAKGVTLFSTLAGPTDEEMQELAAERDDGQPIEETWFSCADGVRTVSTLINALRDEKQWSKGMRAYEVRNLIATLEKLEECLQHGKKKRAKFYFLCC